MDVQNEVKCQEVCINPVLGINLDALVYHFFVITFDLSVINEERLQAVFILCMY